jgi:hypothetical protein
MTRGDRAALRQAIALARQQSPARAEQIDWKLQREPWREVGKFAAFSCQVRALRLKPWQAPPAYAHDEADGKSYGGKVEEVALLQRMLSLGISRWHPSPLEAIAEVEAARAAESAPSSIVAA